MKKSIFTTLVAAVALLLLPAILFAQTTTPPAPAATAPTSPIYTGLQQAFDLNDTNSLVNANEINVTPYFKWNSADEKAGGGLNVDWWVTDQQGAFIGFEEFSGRDSYFSFGYQARTVFKSVEAGIGFGTRQSNNDDFGDVQLFMRPSASVRIVDTDGFDVRIVAGADILNQGRPNPFLGITVRAFKF